MLGCTAIIQANLDSVIKRNPVFANLLAGHAPRNEKVEVG